MPKKILSEKKTDEIIESLVRKGDYANLVKFVARAGSKKKVDHVIDVLIKAKEFELVIEAIHAGASSKKMNEVIKFFIKDGNSHMVPVISYIAKRKLKPKEFNQFVKNYGDSFSKYKGMRNDAKGKKRRSH